MKTRADALKHLKVIESHRPKPTEEGDRIPISSEARELLRPWWNKIEELDGRTLHYTEPPSRGCIYINTTPKRTVHINEALIYKTMGDALVQSTEENRLSEIHTGIKTEDIGVTVRVAERMIKQFKRYGISI